MAVSWVSSFVWGKLPVKVKEEVRATCNLSSGHRLGAVGRKGG